MSSSRLSADARSYMEKNPGVRYQQARDIVAQAQSSANADSTFLNALELMSLTPESVPVEPSTRTYSALDVFIRKVAPRGTQIIVAGWSDKFDVSAYLSTSSEVYALPTTPSNIIQTLRRVELALSEDIHTRKAGDASDPVVAVIENLSDEHLPMFSNIIEKGRDRGVYIVAGNYVTDKAIEALPGTALTNVRKTKRSWFSALGIRDIAKYDPIKMWERTGEMFTDVPLGMVTRDRSSDTSEVLRVNFDDISRGGTGLNGVIQGKTGTGKSNLLHTFITSMCVKNSPSIVNFVLVSNWGGSSLDGLERLPHVRACVTDISENTGRGNDIERLIETLHGECARRRLMLKEYGASNINDYRAKRETNGDMPPLPTLVIVLEELNEYFRHNRHHMELLHVIAKQGRDVGVCAIVVDEFIDSGLYGMFLEECSFGISLSASTTAHSRTVLGIPDAVELPCGHGHAIIRYTDPIGRPRVKKFRGFHAAEQVSVEKTVEDVLIDAQDELSDTADDAAVEGFPVTPEILDTVLGKDLHFSKV